MVIAMPPISYLMFFTIFQFLFLVLALAVQEDGGNPGCKPFDCGSLGPVGFPFFNGTNSDCGIWKIEKCDEQVPRIQLYKDWPWFYVTAISQTNTITLQENNTFSTGPLNNCAYRNLSVPKSPIISIEPYNQTFFRCPVARNHSNFTAACKLSKHFNIGYQNGSTDDEFRRNNTDCSMIQLQLNKTQKGVEFFNLHTGWFRLQLNVTRECIECYQRGGHCTDNQGNFQCSEEPISRTGDRKIPLKLGKIPLKLGLAIGMLAAIGIGIGIFIILAFYFMKRSPDNYMIFWKKKASNYQNIEAFLRNNGSLAPKRYYYSEIKKMTNSFGEKLGEGGYGGVYKGKLLDGRNVAVKVLKEAKGNGEEFINEVASTTRTSHVNIVALLGFCFEGHKRALIYEFMPNGSLDKFIYGNSMETNQKLKWETLYQIAVGIARGLEYLHRGCSTKILHFDIKPHNILLDEEFCPKISDFGLAKICLKKESIISMMVARGTIGYIAPELFSRNFGEVSHKSDVYSYGMMVLEMTGGRQNENVRVDNSSEIYFPHWIYKRLEEDEELGMQGISNEEDKECIRKMIIVSLWCIQTNPSDRPTIDRVVDMLEGSISSLQIPPKPFLSSPGSAQIYSSSTLQS